MIDSKMEKILIQSRTNLNGGELERIKAEREKGQEAALRTALNLVPFVY